MEGSASIVLGIVGSVGMVIVGGLVEGVGGDWWGPGSRRECTGSPCSW